MTDYKHRRAVREAYWDAVVAEAKAQARPPPRRLAKPLRSLRELNAERAKRRERERTK